MRLFKYANRIQITRSVYVPIEYVGDDLIKKGTGRQGFDLNASFATDPRGLEFTDFPETVSHKRTEKNIGDVFTNLEIEEIKDWLSEQQESERVANLKQEWLSLPDQLKRLTDALDSGVVVIDDESIERFSVFDNLLKNELSNNK